MCDQLFHLVERFSLTKLSTFSRNYFVLIICFFSKIILNNCHSNMLFFFFCISLDAIIKYDGTFLCSGQSFSCHSENETDQ